VVRPPSQADEDERRIHRERGRLQKECGGHSNRIRSLLILHGIDLGVSKHFLKDLERVRPLDGSKLGPELKRELVGRSTWAAKGTERCSLWPALIPVIVKWDPNDSIPNVVF
jgi:transposase